MDMATLYYQGHGSYRITTNAGTVVYIDPFAGKGYDQKADLVLVTHEHYDHNKVELVEMKPDGKIIREKDMLIGGVYRHAVVKDVTITAVPAYNAHHDKKECVGYLLETDGIKLYAAGDTSKTDYMKELGKEHLDWAILPIDGIYNMGPLEASSCAKLIGAKHTIPVHMKPGKLFDEATARSFTTDGRVIMHPDEEIPL